MRIIIDVDEAGVGTYQVDDQEPIKCALVNRQMSRDVKPVFSITGALGVTDFLRSPYVDYTISLQLFDPPPAMSPPQTIITEEYCAEDFIEDDGCQYCDYHDWDDWP